jgi:hypothetical protein
LWGFNWGCRGGGVLLYGSDFCGLLISVDGRRERGRAKGL